MARLLHIDPSPRIDNDELDSTSLAQSIANARTQVTQLVGRSGDRD